MNVHYYYSSLGEFWLNLSFIFLSKQWRFEVGQNSDYSANVFHVSVLQKTLNFGIVKIGKKFTSKKARCLSSIIALMVHLKMLNGWQQNWRDFQLLVSLVLFNFSKLYKQPLNLKKSPTSKWKLECWLSGQRHILYCSIMRRPRSTWVWIQLGVDWVECCIFRPAFGCCAVQSLVKRIIFSIFSAKKLKKARNLQQIFAKNMFF